MKREVLAWDPPVEWVKKIIEDAGTTIGSVHFTKKSNGKLRKMTYRLHVQNPQYSKSPRCCENDKLSSSNKRCIDSANDNLTVYDTNKVLRDAHGVIMGRGAYRTIPLKNITRICHHGIVVEIKRS